LIVLSGRCSSEAILRQARNSPAAHSVWRDPASGFGDDTLAAYPR